MEFPVNTERNVTFFTQVIISDGAFIFIGCLLTGIWVFGSILNAACFYMYLRNARMHLPTNILIMSLNLCDFLSCFLAVPPSMLSAWHKRWIWGPQACIVEGVFVYFLMMTSIYILMTIACYRYIAISRPSMNRWITTKTAYTSSAVCYAIGLTWALLPVFGWNEFGIAGTGFTCTVQWRTQDGLFESYVVTSIIVSVLIPMAIVTFCYAHILLTVILLSLSTVCYMTLRRQTIAMSRWGNVNTITARDGLTAEKQILRTALLILMSFIICWLPSLILTIAAYMNKGKYFHPTIRALPPVINRLQGVFDPVICIATNKVMRAALNRALPTACCRAALPDTNRSFIGAASLHEDPVPMTCKTTYASSIGTPNTTQDTTGDHRSTLEHRDRSTSSLQQASHLTFSVKYETSVNSHSLDLFRGEV